MVDATDATFEEVVLERSFQVPVVVDLWAPWCGPCTTLGPMIETIVAATDGAVELAKVNVDEERELAAQFGVHPTQIGQWQRQLLDGALGLFSDDQRRQVENQDALIAELFSL